MVKKIYSQNADFQKFQVLKTNRNKRYKYGEFFVEGVRNINGAVQGGWEIRSFLYTREKPLSRWAEDLLATVKTQVNYQLTAPSWQSSAARLTPPSSWPWWPCGPTTCPSCPCRRTPA